MPRKTTDFIIIHCAATKPSMDIGVAEIRRWHKARGFTDVGYHYIVRRNGNIEEGRRLDAVGAHARGYNDRSIGICCVGGVDESGKPADTRTEEQKHTLKNLIEELRDLYPHAQIVGHRDLPNVRKACPSFDVATWLQEEEILV